ncbi:hypothetical protein [Patulibacter medicamentivorans]|uniref:hypothetical protein n=1 Tax=Patulibacter medicamentivorans TaxID=1097667 RepID=UPI00058F26F5|nr:hypothetical protein [Patulibacter medicamentivorans]
MNRAQRLKKRLVGTVTALLACGVFAAVAAPSASAYEENWGCPSMNPNTWCLNSSVHTWDQLRATWADGTVETNMCAKLIKPNASPEYQYARTCEYSSAVFVFSSDKGRAPYPNTNVGMNALVASGNNPGPRTIYGWAYA